MVVSKHKRDPLLWCHSRAMFLADYPDPRGYGGTMTLMRSRFRYGVVARRFGGTNCRPQPFVRWRGGSDRPAVLSCWAAGASRAYLDPRYPNMCIQSSNRPSATTPDTCVRLA